MDWMFDYRNIDPRLLPEMTSALYKLGWDYPKTIGDIKNIRCESSPKQNLEDPGITLSADIFGNADKARKLLAQAEADNDLAPGTGTPAGIIYHIVGRKLAEAAFTNHEASDELSAALNKYVGNSSEFKNRREFEIRATEIVSRTAAKSIYDLVAQMFAEAKLAKRPRKAALAVAAVLDRGFLQPEIPTAQ